MNRRKFLFGAGSFAAAGAAAMGTGAFTNVTANRDVTVNVANEDNAYLALTTSGSANSQFVTGAESTQLGLDFSSSGNGGSGVGMDSVYNFDDVFRIINQGTQKIYVWAEFTGATLDNDDIWLYPDSSDSRRLQNSDKNVVELGVGSELKIGVHIDTSTLSSTGTENLTATLTADTSKPADSSVSQPDGTLSTAIVSEDPTGDQFESIQEAINSVEGSTVIIESGTYTENLNIDQSGITLRGKDDGEGSIVRPGNSDTEASLIELNDDNITIENLVLEGNNSNLSGEKTVEETPVHAGYAIVTGTDISNISIRKNKIRRFYRGGIRMYPSGGGPSTGNTIKNNLFEDLIGTYPDEYDGEIYDYNRVSILLYNNFYADVVNNTMNRVGVGIQTGNFYNSGEKIKISDNNITSAEIGIWHNLVYGSASTFEITDNKITSVSGEPTESDNVGIYLSSIQGGVDAIVRDNVVTNSAVGFQAWNDPTSAEIVIEGGKSSKNKIGVLAGEGLYYGNDSSDPFTIVVDSTKFSGSTDVDIRAQEDQNSADEEDPEVTVKTRNVSAAGTDTRGGAMIQ